jgi:hypothetical protein
MSHISYDPDEAPQLTKPIQDAIRQGFPRLDVFIQDRYQKTSFVAVGHFLPRSGETIVTENGKRATVDRVEYRLHTVEGVTFVTPLVFAAEGDTN